MPFLSMTSLLPSWLRLTTRRWSSSFNGPNCFSFCNIITNLQTQMCTNLQTHSGQYCSKHSVQLCFEEWYESEMEWLVVVESIPGERHSWSTPPPQTPQTQAPDPSSCRSAPGTNIIFEIYMTIDNARDGRIVISYLPHCSLILSFTLILYGWQSFLLPKMS